MKKICTTLLILFCFTFCKAQQYATIPDTNFVHWLNYNGFASCMNGNQMDTTCSLILSTRTVNCSSSQITNLTGIQYFKSLDTLYCSMDTLVVLPILPASLIYLDCDSNRLDSTLGILPSSLTYLDCSNNQINGFTNLPSSLIYLDCSFNLIDSLPNLPSSLTYLDCSSNNQLPALPALPSSLDTLYCSMDSLFALPTLPASLIYLDCGVNNLTSLPVLPSSLSYFDCDGNQLTTMPALPSLIIYFDCSFNQIASLPGLPAFLRNFDCSFNQLDSLPVLSITLDTLYCNNNTLSHLPTLPNVLSYLDCDGNNLGSLPALPATLLTLYCYSDSLTSLPALLDSMYILDIHDNPGLLCLPMINKINTFQFWSTGIQCFPDYGQITVSTPALDSIPLCYLTSNPNGCLAINSVQQLQVAGFKLQVFPNPTHDMVNIILSQPYTGCLTSVTDVLGREVAPPKSSPGGGLTTAIGETVQLDFSGLASGIYFIRVSAAAGTQTVKVVKE